MTDDTTQRIVPLIGRHARFVVGEFEVGFDAFDRERELFVSCERDDKRHGRSGRRVSLRVGWGIGLEREEERIDHGENPTAPADDAAHGRGCEGERRRR